MIKLIIFKMSVLVGSYIFQMCDGLSEFSSEDGKVTAVSITNLDQGIELLSQVSQELVVPQ